MRGYVDADAPIASRAGDIFYLPRQYNNPSIRQWNRRLLADIYAMYARVVFLARESTSVPETGINTYTLLHLLFYFILYRFTKGTRGRRGSSDAQIGLLATRASRSRMRSLEESTLPAGGRGRMILREIHLHVRNRED